MKEKKMDKKGKKVCKRKFKRKIVMAAAITTISAFAIKAYLKRKSELPITELDDFSEGEKSQFEIVLDDLVADGIITGDQHVIIQTAIVTAMQASLAEENFMKEENHVCECATDIVSTIIGKLLELKDALFEWLPIKGF